MTATPASRPGLRFAAWMVLVLGAFFTLFVGGTYAGLADQPVRIVMQVLTLAVLGTWLVGIALRPDWRPQGPISVALGIAVVGSGIATVTSVNPRLSLEAFLVGASVAGTFLLLLRLAQDRWFRPRLATLIVAIPFVVAAGNLAQVLLLWIEWWGYVGRFVAPPLRPAEASLTLGGPNVLPGYLLLMAPLGAAILVGRRSGRPLAALLLILSVAAIAISGSRGGLLAVGVAVLVAGALLVAGGASIRGVLASGRGRASVAGVLVIGVVLALLLGPALFGRFLQSSGLEQRLDLWRSAVAIFLDHPIFGSGPGTWALLKFAYNPEGTVNLVVPHAHNIVLQALAETGLVGLASVIPIVVLVAGRILRRVVATAGAVRLEAIAVASGLAGFLAHNMVDNLMNLPAIGLMLAAVLAWMLTDVEAPTASERPPAQGRRALRPVWAALAVVLVVSAGWFTWHSSSAAMAAERGRDAVAHGDWAAAHDRFNEAAAADIDITLYLAELAVAGTWVSEADSEVVMLQRVITEDPYPFHLLSLARLEVDTDRAHLALDHIRVAWARGSQDPQIALNVAAIAEAAGELELANEAYLQTLRLDPMLVGAAYWREADRKVSIEALADQLRSEFEAAGDEVGAAMVRARTGDPAGALPVLEALPPSTSRDVALADTLELLDRREDAVVLLRGTLERDPLAAGAATWLAGAAKASGDLAGAARYRRWAHISGTGAFARPADLGGEVTDDPFEASPIPHNYSWAVYLRHKPVVFVVTGIVAIAPWSLDPP